MSYCRTFCLICSLILPLAACGSEQSSSSPAQGGYKETKTMVIDILKTDEGRKAIMESLTSSSGSSSSSEESGSSSSSDSGSSGDSGSGESGSSGSSGSSGTLGIKMLLPNQSYNDVRLAVKETITAPEYKKEIEKIMTDPQFAGDFAKVINSQSKDLHLQLIKDPTYQKSVMDIMKSPEVAKMFLDLTKTSDYRKQTMTIMQEAMQNPIFKMEIMDLLRTVVQEQLTPEVEKSSQQSSGQEGSKSGGESGGSNGGGGGGSGSGS
nr:spore germination lipoprotein GerD [Paenibacillus pinistramenti]